MYILNYLRSIIPILIFSMLSACGGGSSGGGGGGGGTVPPIVPTNAVTLNETNAAETLEGAAFTTSAILSSVGVEASIVSAGQILAVVKDIIKNIRANQNIANTEVVSGVTYGGSCDIDGTWSVTSNETATSESGTISFIDCEDFPSLIINGSMTFDLNWNNSTSEYSDTISGGLSGSMSGLGISLTSINITESGNEDLGSYSINTMTYAFDTSQGGGFSLQTAPAIVGVVFQCPTSGAYTITGGNDTQARATYNGYAGGVNVDVDTGSGFTAITGSPVACSGWGNF